MALENANSILFEFKQRRFFKLWGRRFEDFRKEAHFTVWNKHIIRNISKDFWHLDSYPVEHHSIIKILILDKLFRPKNEFTYRRGIVILPEINLFTFISLLLRIRSRFTCRCRLFFEITNSFISNETFELTMFKRRVFFLFHLFYKIHLCLITKEQIWF